MDGPLARWAAGERSRVECPVARRGKALDVVSAAIPGDAVAGNKLVKL